MWSEIKIAWSCSCWPRCVQFVRKWIFRDVLDYALLDDVRGEENSSPPRHVTFRVRSLASLRNPAAREAANSRIEKSWENFSSRSSCRCFRWVAVPRSDRKSSDFYFKNEKKRFMRATGAENFDLILFSNFENSSNFADFGNTSRRVSASRKQLGVSLRRATSAHGVETGMISPAEIKQSRSSPLI